ncbi:5-formyltetrahydrofolate cyclo-ligase [Vibrio genomosp. F10 str. 9ZC157]|uniref:5-formyltetrahydrofolate cyclo-ligase n=1 Tax=Vibrio genomosp. F10 str. ZF-129 TaxID=1187848 RepID=A0A1E5BF16_9VIBR|nr:5-formyltetrahydrofolate cyclo-ligase [Vibrio genomosp. F10]OEE34293.1 5-formyltetrahydrofolate cyclo-ligase [Vibrio genomosp. F10 str. ZF-129]OEE95744.1 5-formyltetrahydrofolate cyclo-ligase [Vibrio genomosp. F10 str. 9ZC157]OEF01345.1 5-formyltetrahydrofolate cyclo-ligase [Vibrio genomosp. F10 str. 9ZD137]
MTLSRQAIRSQIRTARNQLHSDTQHQAGIDLIQQFSTLPECSASSHIALYLSTDGEINTTPLIEWLWAQGKSTYLPVLHPFSKGHLLFLHYTPTTPLALNRYQIVEPKLNQALVKPVAELDLICTPLVAFDSTGQRLGMGGGYYDRTLETWFKHKQGPVPIGLAHDCQYIETLPSEIWDVPLPKIVTPSKVWQWES